MYVSKTVLLYNCALATLDQHSCSLKTSKLAQKFAFFSHFLSHFPTFLTLSRLLTSFYEALNINAQLECAKKGMDFFPLWFLFAIVAMNILLVKKLITNKCVVKTS